MDSGAGLSGGAGGPVLDRQAPLRVGHADGDGGGRFAERSLSGGTSGGRCRAGAGRSRLCSLTRLRAGTPCFARPVRAALHIGAGLDAAARSAPLGAGTALGPTARIIEARIGHPPQNIRWLVTIRASLRTRSERIGERVGRCVRTGHTFRIDRRGAWAKRTSGLQGERKQSHETPEITGRRHSIYSAVTFSRFDSENSQLFSGVPTGPLGTPGSPGWPSGGRGSWPVR